MQAPAPRLRDRAEVAAGLAFWIVAGSTAAACGAGLTFLPYAVPVLALACAWPFVRAARWSPVLIDWLPLPLVVLTYGMLHAVVPACWEATIDGSLASADRALFGDHLGVVLEPFTSTPLTLLMAICYASYYVVPVALAWRWWRRDRLAFRELMIGEVGALFVGYLGYLFLPAVGPHAHLPAATFGAALEGDFIGAAIRALNARHGGVFPRDAFPSLHTANAVTALIVVWRRERRLFVACAPVLGGLIVATMYLRFHYAVDVLAGAALAVAWHALVVRLVAVESAQRIECLQSGEAGQQSGEAGQQSGESHERRGA